MHLGHPVLFYFTDTSTGQRSKRAGVVNLPPSGTTVSVFVFFSPSDRIQGGTQSPSSQQSAVVRSSQYYGDDPALAAAGTSCWSDV